jgi:O-antigen ligase
MKILSLKKKSKFINSILKYIVAILFLASVFITSKSFVNTENTVKFYFTVFSVFFLISINIFFHKKQQTIVSFSSLKGFNIVGVFQALYGILQYLGFFSSNNNNFIVTGSFENPAGFAAIVALTFPIGLVGFLHSKRLEKFILFPFLTLLLFSVVLSGSRAGILAITISTFSIITLKLKLISKIKNSKKNKLLSIILSVVFFISMLGLYKLKPNSANGRLLIWQVSFDMIKDKPFFGFGYGGFKANYMDYQANYFKNNQNSKYKILADNISHPFNEFIKIIVNFGTIGLLIYLLLLFFLIKKIFTLPSLHKMLFTGILVAFLTFSLFSYPLHYAPIWFLLFYCFLLIFKEKITKQELSKKIKLSVFAILCFSFLFFIFQMTLELHWKKIAEKSLQGNTKEMLPKYEKIYPYFKRNPLFLYNYGAELNFINEYKRSIEILEECKKSLHDYDVQMLLADNYYNLGEVEKAINAYKHASNMIPSRFLPLYELVKIFKETNKKSLAIEVAKEIRDKPVKIPSSTVNLIKKEINELLSENKIN